MPPVATSESETLAAAPTAHAPSPHPLPASHGRFWDRLFTLLAFALPFAAYAFTATRTIQGGDTAEFVVVAAAGGVTHPPGYPLHGLVSRLFAALPFGTPPYRVALLSAVAGALSVMLLFRVGRRLTGNAAASLAAALCFAVAPVQWKLAGVPEVFTLLGLTAALVLLAALRLAEAAPRRVVREAGLLGLAFGLGLANHHTIVLCAPIGLYALAACARSHGRAAAVRAALVAAGGLAAGLLLYAWLPLAARHGAFVWGEPGTARGLARHILRSEYGTFSLGLSPAPLRPLHHAGHFLASLPRAYFYVFFAFGLAGIALGLKRRRGFASAVLASFFLAGLLFPALFNLPEGPLSREVAARFHLLPTLLFAPFVACGLAAVLPRLSRPAAGLASAAPVALAALASFGAADWRSERTIERYLVVAASEIKPGSVVLGQGDLELFGFAYVCHVLGLRPDIRYVDVHLLRHAWYHRRVQAGLPGVTLPFDPKTTRLADVVASVATRRPTYLTVSLATLAHTVPLYPEGLLPRVALPPAPVPDPATLEPRLARQTEALGPHRPPLDAWAAHVRTQAALPWRTLAAAHERAGDVARAEACLGRARLIAGDSP